MEGNGFAYGTRSCTVYNSLCPELKKVFHPKFGVLRYRDHSLIEGFRPHERQDHLFATGKSKVAWPNSKHNTWPSDAVDAIPYPFKSEWWNSEKYFHVWAEWGSWVKGFAAANGVLLRWGFDWDGDFDLKDQTFYDGPHFEVVRRNE